MDITQTDFTNIVTFFVGIGALIKGFLSDNKANKAETRARDIEEDRALTKVQRDQEVQELKTTVAVLQTQYEEVRKRLAEGNEQFKALDDKVDTTNNRLNITNDLLNQIVGALKNSGLKFNGGEL